MDRAFRITALLAVLVAVTLGVFYILWPQITLSRRKAYSAAAVTHVLEGGGPLSIESDFSEPPFIADDFSSLAQLPGAEGTDWDSKVLSPAAVLEAPAIELTLPVFFGAGSEALRFGAGLVKLPSAESSEPSYVLAGVCGAATGDRFAGISELAEGDELTLTLAGGEKTLCYTVREVQTIPAGSLTPELSSAHYESWLALAAPSSPVSTREYTLVWAKLDK